MAHNLNAVKGKTAFAFNIKEGRPWHGLGTPVQGTMTVEEAITKGGVDFEVEKQAIQTTTNVQTDKWVATVRKDTNVILGVVGRGYEVVQNRTAFAFFNHAMGEGAAAIETVGALGAGERVFMMARMPEEIEVVHDDLVDRFLLLTTSHDGSYAIKVLFTPVRVVCQNTLHAAINGAKHVISIKHTKNVEAGLEEAHRLLTTGEQYWQRVRAAYRWMAQREVDSNRLKNVLDKLFPPRPKTKEIVDPETGEATSETVDEIRARTLRVRNRIIELFDGSAEGFDLAGHTDWGLYNAITQWIDHERPSRTGINRWENSVFGLGNGLRQKAFDVIVGTELPEQELLVAQGL